MGNYRTVKDSMGELDVPAEASYGAQTQRAIENFPVSGLPMPRAFLEALGRVKLACAQSNHDIGAMEQPVAAAIGKVCERVIEGALDDQFPVDVFQTGSGTSTNMNANEVIAYIATSHSGIDIHPNDDVNMSQSSNDVIPTAIHVSAVLGCERDLLPALRHLQEVIDAKAKEVGDTVTTGRTHLMDAMPVTFAQELSGWSAQVGSNIRRIEGCLPDLRRLAIGGTAVGTGINAPQGFAEGVCGHLAESTGIGFAPGDNRFELLSSQDAAVALSGALKTTAVSLMKVANDLRWMNSGPLAGIGEIELPALQPGSSIMPGKVNPVIPESTAMVCAQVIGNDAAITVAGQSGNFQLNVMLPLIAYDLLQSIGLLASSSRLLADRALSGFRVNHPNVDAALSKNPILVTALNRVIGYELGAKIAKRAYEEKRPVIEVAVEMTDLARDELERLLSPAELTKGGARG